LKAAKAGKNTEIPASASRRAENLIVETAEVRAVKFELSLDHLEEICAYLNQHADEIGADLQRLVEIPSVKSEPEKDMPFGRECARALETALNIAKEKGLETENCENWYGLVHWGSGLRHIGIFSHLDVVSAGDAWIYEPFSCTEKDGWIIGRGVGDDKIAAVIGIYTLCALRELNLAENTRFTVFLGCNEESGMADIKKYTQQQEQPDFCLVPDIRFPVCLGERGIIKTSVEKQARCSALLSLSGGELCSKVPSSCTAKLALSQEQTQRILEQGQNTQRITATAADGVVTVHAQGIATSISGAANGLNAIGLLSDFLRRSASLPDTDIQILDELAGVGTSWKGEYMGLACSDERSGELTSVCTFAQFSNGKWTLGFDTRYPVTFEGASIQEKLLAYFAAHGWKLLNLTDSPPRDTKDCDAEVAILEKCWTDVSGKTLPSFVIGGGTYARHLRRAVGYGPDDGQHCPFLPEGHGGIHGPDEARSIQGIAQAFAAYIHGCSELSKYLNHIEMRDLS
jgi:succinyl-diaminopimelate desuccinylase